MVTKRIRSEYMKKFKDPKWETYTRCYEEMLKYRLTRRLLEQTHNPWFWSGSDSDSESGGKSPPPPNKNQVETSGKEPEAQLEGCEGERADREQDQQTRTTGPVPSLPIQDGEEENGPQSGVNGNYIELSCTFGCTYVTLVYYMMLISSQACHQMVTRTQA